MNPTCIHCNEEIGPDDTTITIAVIRNIGPVVSTLEPGVAHIECAHRASVGGIGHHLNHDYWCTQMHDPDGGRTYRQSALEVSAGHLGTN